MIKNVDSKAFKMKFSIKELRERAGYTQTQTAVALGMTLGNYQKYEYGKI